MTGNGGGKTEAPRRRGVTPSNRGRNQRREEEEKHASDRKGEKEKVRLKEAMKIARGLKTHYPN